MKKFVCVLLSIAMCATILTGCNLFSHNLEKDYMQVIATIQPISGKGTRSDGTEWSYTSEKKEILKTQLMSYLNSQGSSSIEGGVSVEQTVEKFADQLVLMELVLIEADMRLEAGDIVWTMEDIDTVQKGVYKSIDDELFTIYNKILESRDKPLLTEPSTEETKTTYPLFSDDYPDKDAEETPPVYYEGKLGPNHDEWYLDADWYIEDAKYQNKYPGFFGDIEEKSLAREAMKRLVTQLGEDADNLIKLSADEKKQVKADVEEIKRVRDEKGIEFVYPMLGRTTLIKKLYGDTLIKSQKMTVLQNYLTDSVKVSDDDVYAKYRLMAESQQKSYDANISAYDTAITGDDKDTVLYNPQNNRYVFVKQILLQFTDETSKYLIDYQEHHTDKEYARELEVKARDIEAYEHVDGEDDLDRRRTGEQVWQEVKAAVKPLAASPVDATRKFNELIYKYNQDPGSFANEIGYAVKYKLDEEEEETYMKEFADGARSFIDDGYAPGQLLDDYVLTSYGIHIMFYMGSTANGVKNLRDYQTIGRYTTYYDIIKDKLLKTAQESVVDEWQQSQIYYYTKTDVKVVKKQKILDKIVEEING